jgi:hypothetical protein
MLKSMYRRVRQAGNSSESSRKSLQHEIEGPGFRSLRVEPLEDRRMLAVFTVNSVLDTVDFNIGDGLAEDAAGNTTLRAAIMEANFAADTDTINIPAGKYDLSIVGVDEDAAATGDLDITENVNIIGAGPDVTIIEAAWVGDRIFHVASDYLNPVTFDLQNITLTGGRGGESNYGGAVKSNHYSYLSISHCIFDGNSTSDNFELFTSGWGSAIHSYATTLSIENCLFTNNFANSSGTIYASGNNVTILDSTFSDNVAAGTSAIENHADVMTIERCTFSNNTGYEVIDNHGGDHLTIINSTISGNQGSGIHTYDDLKILNSTITENYGGSRGGGLDISTGSDSPLVEVENTIITKNTSLYTGPNVDGPVTSLGHNLIDDATGSTGFGTTGDLIGVDPKLAPLGFGGGLTQTHALLVGSPAIGSANAASAPTIDQRGFARTSGPATDIGAFEAFGGGDLAGSVFNDLNGDGVHDSGEPGLAGWTVYLDENTNGQYDKGSDPTTFTGERSVQTDVNGDYALADLPPGSYVIGLVNQIVWDQTAPATENHTASVVTGVTTANLDFGNIELQTAATTISVSDDGEASDIAPFDGVFESLDTTFYKMYVSHDLTPEAPLERRTLMEFDLSSVPVGEQISTATLTLNIGSYSARNKEYATIRLYGYSGNGIVELEDATTNAIELAQLPVPTGNTLQIPIDPDYIQSMIDSGTHVGFRVEKAPTGESEFAIYSIEYPTSDICPKLTIETAMDRTLDFGDAPAEYPVLFVDNGARHIATGPMLGTSRDIEYDGQPTTEADGDDLIDVPDDEDGLVNTPFLAPGIRDTPIDIQASEASFLNAWIDFNADRVWDASEQVAVDLPMVAGTNQFLLDIPLTTPPVRIFARFRLTSYDTGGTLLPTGLADDGEVEDHQLQVLNDLYLYGEDGVDDQITFWPGTPGVKDHQININGESSRVNASAFDEFRFDGLGGNDTFNIVSKTTAEVADFSGASVHMYENAIYDVFGEGFESTTLFYTGGADSVTMTGTSGDDKLYLLDGYSYLRGNTNDFLNYMVGFPSVAVDASSGGGTDRIYMYDGVGDEILTAGETQISVDYDSAFSPGVNVEATGFDMLNVYGGNGGYDVATLTGSAGNDKFTARDLYGRLVGNDGAYIHYVEGFDQVTGDASGTTGTDVAILFDAEGDDHLEAGEVSASLDLDATPGVDDPNLIANGFGQVYAYAIRGGNDSALLTGSDSADRFTSKRTYSTLKRRDGAFFNYAAGWDEVTADVSGGAGADLAFIYDDATDDLFEAGPTQATLDYDATGSPGVDTTAIGFDQVYAYAERGGNDSAILTGSTGVDKYFGLATYSYLKADDNSYFNYARGFDAVTANAVGTGDLAFMYDSNGDDILDADSAFATFTLNPTVGGQVVNTAAAFDQVYGYASGGGTDTANLTGTSGADAFKGDTDWGYLRSKGSSDYFNYVRYFDNVFADPGDTDVGNDDLDDLGVGYVLDSTPGNGNAW